MADLPKNATIPPKMPTLDVVLTADQNMPAFGCCQVLFLLVIFYTKNYKTMTYIIFVKSLKKAYDAWPTARFAMQKHNILCLAFPSF
jgi:hypothetical protein